jgi:formylglycine-generating enzyme
MRTAALAIVLLSATLTSANVLNMPPGLTSLETVPVGDPGNAGDSRYGGYGSVAYTYNIGKYEVTAGQYCEFLNAVAATDTHGLYNGSMWSNTYGCKIQRTGSSGSYSYSVASGDANRPVNYVSYWDACRFANWSNNGQGNGDTETGAYTLQGYNSFDGHTIHRNTEWKWAAASEDEWYKAAYYDSATGSYYDYPTSSNSINTGMANYEMAVGHTTDVGSYGYSSPYGTFDQGGNVSEWNESLVVNSIRGLRGGAFVYGYGVDTLRVSSRGANIPSYEDYSLGFRVVQVPEPVTLVLLALGGMVVMRRR